MANKNATLMSLAESNDETSIGFLRSGTEYQKFKEVDDSTFDISKYTLPTVDYSETDKRFGLFRHLWKTYDHSALVLIALNYFNNGAASMILMVLVNMYQEVYSITARNSQYYIAMIGFPCCLGFFYGLFSESVPIMGSRKKSYLLIMSFL
jgi:hypothetical protein